MRLPRQSISGGYTLYPIGVCSEMHCGTTGVGVGRNPYAGDPSATLTGLSERQARFGKLCQIPIARRAEGGALGTDTIG